MSESRNTLFPQPNPDAKLKKRDVVWVQLHGSIPYWPAQIKSIKNRSSGSVLVKTFYDPKVTLSVGVDNQFVATDVKKIKKKNRNLERTVQISDVLRWEETKSNGEPINYDDVIREYLDRTGLKELEEVNDALWNAWNTKAIGPAQKEFQSVTQDRNVCFVFWFYILCQRH
eukprot:252192_1